VRSRSPSAWFLFPILLAAGAVLAQATSTDIEDLVRNAEGRAAQLRSTLTGLDPEDTIAKSRRFQDEAEALNAGNRARLQEGMGFLSQQYRFDPYADPDEDIGPGVIYVAVSLSMPKDSLRQLAREAHAAGAILVIRGLVDNSFLKTQKVLKTVFVEGEDAGLVIDPRVFEQYKITEVPTVIAAPQEVQSCEVGLDCVRPEVPFDAIRGNISLKTALQYLSDKGDAAPEASRQALARLEG